jgi:tetratricopeptide (TPR) repeat protein
MMRIIAIALIFLAWPFQYFVFGAEQHSQCEQKDWYEKFFSRHTLELSLCSDNKDRACFVSDGSYIKVVGDDWSNEFELNVGESFGQEPDHHGFTSFRLEAIQKDGVDVQYTSRFDHRSFGKDLLTEDTCRIFLPFKTSVDIKDSMVAFNMGSVYFSKGDYETAAQYYKKAIELEPDNPANYHVLGDVYFELDDVTQAISYYEQGNRIKPGHNEIVYEKLGDIYSNLDQSAKARENYLKAIERSQQIGKDWHVQRVNEKMNQLK